MGHLVLNVEDVAQGALILLGPHVAVGRGIDQLSGDAHAIAACLDAALEDVAYAKIAPDFSHADRLALVGHDRVAGDDE